MGEHDSFWAWKPEAIKIYLDGWYDNNHPSFYITDVLYVAMSIAEERMSPLKQKTIEQKCFHWEIDNWSQLSHEERGPVCQVGGFQW